jgi:ABC-type branched-subunit amino acid transport system ATPase component
MNALTQDTVLSAQGLVMRFGGIAATNNVTLNLKQGARHALIGPNGAGKTTLINLLTGVLQPTSGKILLQGEDITLVPAHQRVQRGLVRFRSTSCLTRSRRWRLCAWWFRTSVGSALAGGARWVPMRA